MVAGITAGTASRSLQPPSSSVAAHVQAVQGRLLLCPRQFAQATLLRLPVQPDRQHPLGIASQELHPRLAAAVVDAALQPVPLDQLHRQLTQRQGNPTNMATPAST